MFVFVFGSLLSFALTFGVIQFYRRFAMYFGIIDMPSERSMHTHPMPRGAGVCFFIGFTLTLAVLYFMGELSIHFTYPIFLGGSVVMLLGYWDDLQSLPASVRLFVQMLASVFIVALLTNGFSKPVEISFLPSWPWLTALFCVLYVAWFVNLYNFMDGSDGLATLVGIIGSGIISAASYFLSNIDLAIIYSALAFSLLAFLTLNWHPAVVFMGDSGAYFLGYVFGAFALLSKIVYDTSLYVHLIVFGMFVVDATWTLVVRGARGQKVYQPHKQHAFQKLLAAGLSHQQVAFLYSAVMLLWLLPMTILTLMYSMYSFLFLVIAYLPIFFFIIWTKAGTETPLELKKV
ncbi:MAG: glycosyltransferase family 4 protein [Bdellovibrionaceae bacterium]|nr:glycosyltransferase family 4 protein [Pseudobdellovibrionaceae bacterium]